MTSSEAETPRGGTDVAALSAGVVAVVISLQAGPGEYGVMNLVTSAALIVVLVAFTWRHSRKFDASLALAAVLALAALPAIGFFAESCLGDGIWIQIAKPYFEQSSRVPDWVLALAWLIGFVSISLVDALAQRRRERSTKQPSEASI